MRRGLVIGSNRSSHGTGELGYLNGKTEKARGLSDRNLNYSKQGGEMSLQGKVALITGASMEPGSEVAVALARAGAKVAVEGAAGVQEKVLRTVETFGGDALPVRGDLLDESDVRHILSNVEAILGPVDILVNASGMTLDKSLEEADVGEWEQAAIAKAKAAFIFSKAIVPGMKERGQGHVISIVSPFGAGTAGGAAEQALGGFTSALGQEVSGSGVVVSQLEAGSSNSDDVAEGVVLLSGRDSSSSNAALSVGD